MLRSLPRRALAVLVLVALAGAIAACSDDPAPLAVAEPLSDIGQGVQGPAGLEATTYATGIEHAAAFAFDDQGRLWVSTAEFQDTGTDGVWLVASPGATPVQVVADLHTPLGLLWHDDSLYVASIGAVERYSGFDGTSFAQTTTVVSFPDDAGVLNGLALGPDGRISMGISATCDNCTPTATYSAAVVSFLPDGSDLRVDATSIRAPVGLAYYPGTDDLFVTMNQRDDLGEATPGDWLSVVAPGQDWGFPDCYGQGGQACDGVPGPVAVLDEHAAVAGVAIVTGQLGTSVGNSALVAEWATGKVLRVALAPDGDGWQSAVVPFLDGVGQPVAVALAPDGSIVVGDWGSGTIYRVAQATG